MSCIFTLRKFPIVLWNPAFCYHRYPCKWKAVASKLYTIALYITRIYIYMALYDNELKCLHYSTHKILNEVFVKANWIPLLFVNERSCDSRFITNSEESQPQQWQYACNFVLEKLKITWRDSNCSFIKGTYKFMMRFNEYTCFDRLSVLCISS